MPSLNQKQRRENFLNARVRREFYTNKDKLERDLSYSIPGPPQVDISIGVNTPAYQQIVKSRPDLKRLDLEGSNIWT